MSTRGVIAVRVGQKDSWTGKFVNSDADMVGEVVREIIARDGLEVARDMLVEDSLGWFTVDGKMEQQLYPWHSAGTTAEAPGYGVAFTVNAHPSCRREITEKNLDWDIEWVHIIERDGSVTSLKHTFEDELIQV
jgi:hypothetical protein